MTARDNKRYPLSLPFQNTEIETSGAMLDAIQICKNWEKVDECYRKLDEKTMSKSVWRPCVTLTVMCSTLTCMPAV